MNNRYRRKDTEQKHKKYFQQNSRTSLTYPGLKGIQDIKQTTQENKVLSSGSSQNAVAQNKKGS